MKHQKVQLVQPKKVLDVPGQKWHEGTSETSETTRDAIENERSTWECDA
jgi:hypothetical protein